MARKKKDDQGKDVEVSTKMYKGVVIEAFKLGKKTYQVGDDFVTESEVSLQLLINRKLIKK